MEQWSIQVFRLDSGKDCKTRKNIVNKTREIESEEEKNGMRGDWKGSARNVDHRFNYYTSNVASRVERKHGEREREREREREKRKERN